jgi:hypothetical protein
MDGSPDAKSDERAHLNPMSRIIARKRLQESAESFLNQVLAMLPQIIRARDFMGHVYHKTAMP